MKVRVSTLAALAALALATNTSLSAFSARSASAEAAGFTTVPLLHGLGHLVSLAGSIQPRVSSSRRVSPVASGSTLGAVVSLQVRDRAGLQRFIQAVYDPRSPLYHHFLTPDQFAARFAPTPAQRGQITSWLRSQGLHVVQQYRNGLGITVSGTASQVERTFATSIYNYRHGNLTFFANAGPLHVPEGIRAQVASVTGLSNADRPVALGLRDRAQLRVVGRDGYLPKDDAGLAPASPKDLTSFYDLQSLYSSGLNGNGVTIALVQFSQFSSENVATFDSQYGIGPLSAEVISVSNGTTTGPSAQDTRVNQNEAELDIETVHGVASNAHLLVYEAPGAGGGLAAWLRIVSDNRAQIVTTSYGKAETQQSQDGMAAVTILFEEAAAQGQTILGPSGDNGAYDASDVNGDPNTDQLVVDFPASSPWITAVGGTMVQQNGDGTITEVPWKEPSNDPNCSYKYCGGGGGLSRVFKRPSYQVGPGVNNQYSNGMRQVPDVSGLAGNPGYAIYTADPDTGRGTWAILSGTSASTPYWAGYVALLDQWLGSQVGFLNPTLYALGSKATTFAHPPFNDITQGDNLYYPATPGWDFATGWGTMDGTVLFNDIHDMGGPQIVHPVDFTVKAVVGTVNGRKVTPVTSVKRGQSVYVAGNEEVLAAPPNSQVSLRLAFGTAKKTLLNKTIAWTITKDEIFTNNLNLHGYKVSLSKKAPTGTYTLTVTETVGSVTQHDTTQVRVR